MSTRAVVTSIFASLGVLIIGWQAGSAVISSTSQPPTTTTNSGAGGTGGTTATDTGTTPPSTATGGTATDGTYTGSDVSTRFGNVQVKVTVSNGAITDVTALHLTDDDRRSAQISSRAAPILASEVVASQSARVSNVSGATYTSDAYLQSVQSALDQAGL